MIEMTITTQQSRWTRYELQIALVDGLFQPQKKISRADLQRRQIDAYYDWRNNGQLYPKAIHLQLIAPYLGVEAETVLLSLLSIAEAKQSGSFCDFTARDDAVPMLLEPEQDAQSKKIGVIQTTRYAVLKAAGMSDSQPSYDRLTYYLRQLSQVWIYYANMVSGWEGNDGFLKYRLNKKTDKLMVQINWRLAGAVFGDYLRAYIDLRERHQLKTAGAKTLHRWLSAHIWPGKSSTLHYETLVSHIWPDTGTTGTASAHRVRIHRLKHDILPGLAQLPQWELTPALHTVQIARQNNPRLSVSQSSSTP